MPLSMPNRISVCVRVCVREIHTERERERTYSLGFPVVYATEHAAQNTVCVCERERQRYIYIYRERTYSLGFPIMYATEHAEQNTCVRECLCPTGNPRESVLSLSLCVHPFLSVSLSRTQVFCSVCLVAYTTGNPRE